MQNPESFHRTANILPACNWRNARYQQAKENLIRYFTRDGKMCGFRCMCIRTHCAAKRCRSVVGLSKIHRHGRVEYVSKDGGLFFCHKHVEDASAKYIDMKDFSNVNPFDSGTYSNLTPEYLIYELQFSLQKRKTFQSVLEDQLVPPRGHICFENNLESLLCVTCAHYQVNAGAEAFEQLQLRIHDGYVPEKYIHIHVADWGSFEGDQWADLFPIIT